MAVRFRVGTITDTQGHDISAVNGAAVYDEKATAELLAWRRYGRGPGLERARGWPRARGAARLPSQAPPVRAACRSGSRTRQDPSEGRKLPADGARERAAAHRHAG